MLAHTELGTRGLLSVGSEVFWKATDNFASSSRTPTCRSHAFAAAGAETAEDFTSSLPRIRVLGLGLRGDSVRRRGAGFESGVGRRGKKVLVGPLRAMRGEGAVEASREAAGKVRQGDGNGSVGRRQEEQQALSSGSQGIGQPSAKEKLLRVAVDVDEVLGSFLPTLNIFCEETYDVKHDLAEFFVYEFRKIWNCSQEEANQRVHAFFQSSHFKDGIPTIPGAHEALSRLHASCDLVVVTSRQHVIKRPTLDWLDTHYKGLFSEVHFGNHFALEGASKPKSEMCKSLRASMLIDDNPSYAMECAEHGIHVLLFDWKMSYAWSKTKDGPTHPLITRVQDWAEVEQVIEMKLQMKKEETSY